MTATPSHLPPLTLDPEAAAVLSAADGDALISFLLRWEHYALALQVLDVLREVRPGVVALLDARASALLGLSRAREALEVATARQGLRRSTTAAVLEARCHLALGEARQALAIAEAVAGQSATQAALALLVDARLAMGNLTGALEAAQRLRADASEASRAYLLAMFSWHQAMGDPVSASGYAVRLEKTAERLEALPAYLLRRLRDHYRGTSEVHRLALVEAALSDAYEEDGERLAPLLARLASLSGDQDVRRPASVPEAAEEQAPSTVITGPGAVSDEERERLSAAAEALFGHRSFLSGQAETLAATLRGSDVLTVLPTGGGKSLCYQLPAMMEPSGTTLVISPLIALMKDQVESLPEALAAKATSITSALDGRELDRRMAGVAAGAYRLVYAAPERLRQPSFLAALRQAPVRRLVIDEAHCVSMWGHDFRPDYLYVGWARQALGSPPVLAMTATAPPRIREDILRRVAAAPAGAAAPTVVIEADVDRPNLYLEAIRAADQDEKLQALLRVCLAEDGSGIVYVSSRARAESLAELLKSHGVRADYYHAGIADPAERAARQDAFMTDKTRVIVATIAFGMGVDKPDIRFIVHFDPSASLEAYYQEAGRAGRDGLPARCVLLHAPSDRATLTRRANCDKVTIEDLREVYAAVRQRLGRARLGRVALEDLCRGERDQETRVRVALSMLEEAGQLRRHQDVPREVTLRWAAAPQEASGQEDPAWRAICAAARLAPGTQVVVDPLALAAAAGLEAAELEGALWRSAERGYLEVRPFGRDMLLEILPPADDAPARVSRLLDSYLAVQTQRIDEIVAYARTRRCRHGHISAYLMGHGGSACGYCDNCAPRHPLRRESTRHETPAEEQLADVLQVLEDSGHGWGRMSLLRILRGDPAAPERGMGLAGWGALGHRSPRAVDGLIGSLISGAFLVERTLDHGGVVIELAAKGRRALADPALLGSLTRRATRAGTGSSDPELYERLRQWRNDTAQARGVAPFVILSNAILRDLAAEQPTSREGLLQVRGMGPKRTEQWGQELLALIREFGGKEA
jgi:ATP-dependent DNA helicase RecQ